MRKSIFIFTYQSVNPTLRRSLCQSLFFFLGSYNSFSNFTRFLITTQSLDLSIHIFSLTLFNQMKLCRRMSCFTTTPIKRLAAWEYLYYSLAYFHTLFFKEKLRTKYLMSFDVLTFANLSKTVTFSWGIRRSFVILTLTPSLTSFFLASFFFRIFFCFFPFSISRSSIRYLKVSATNNVFEMIQLRPTTTTTRSTRHIEREIKSSKKLKAEQRCELKNIFCFCLK